MSRPHRLHHTTRLIHAFARAHDSTSLDLVGAYRIISPTFSTRCAVAALTHWIRRYQRAPGVEPDPMSLLELKALVGLAHFFSPQTPRLNPVCPMTTRITWPHTPSRRRRGRRPSQRSLTL